MTTLQTAVPTPRFDLDALSRLNESDHIIADDLETEYFGIVKKSKGLSILKGHYRGDVKFVAITEGDSFPRQLNAQYGCHRSILTIDANDMTSLERFTNIMELLNDKYERIDRGRPFKSVERYPPYSEFGMKHPYLVFVIRIYGDE